MFEENFLLFSHLLRRISRGAWLPCRTDSTPLDDQREDAGDSVEINDPTPWPRRPLPRRHHWEAIVIVRRNSDF